MSARAPEPTKRDLDAWRRLAATAEACARAPTASAGDLAQAAKRAKTSIVIGVLDRANPCVRLVGAAQLFARETDKARREMAAGLLEVALEVKALVVRKAEATATQAVRKRADLDG